MLIDLTKWRKPTREEREQLANCKHKNLYSEIGHSVNIEVGEQIFYNYVCKDCGFECPFYCDLREAIKSWPNYITNADFYIPIK